MSYVFHDRSHSYEWCQVHSDCVRLDALDDTGNFTGRDYHFKVVPGTGWWPTSKTRVVHDEPRLSQVPVLDEFDYAQTEPLEVPARRQVLHRRTKVEERWADE